MGGLLSFPSPTTKLYSTWDAGIYTIHIHPTFHWSCCLISICSHIFHKHIYNKCSVRYNSLLYICTATEVDFTPICRNISNMSQCLEFAITNYAHIQYITEASGFEPSFGWKLYYAKAICCFLIIMMWKYDIFSALQRQRMKIRYKILFNWCCGWAVNVFF